MVRAWEFALVVRPPPVSLLSSIFPASIFFSLNNSHSSDVEKKCELRVRRPGTTVALLATHWVTWESHPVLLHFDFLMVQVGLLHKASITPVACES